MSLQTIVTNAPLSEDVRTYLLDRIAKEGSTADVIATVKEALQEYIDTGFKAMNIDADQNDPRVVAAKQTLQEETQTAMTEFEETMENLNIDAAVAQAKANKAIDGVQASALKTQMAA